MPKNCGTVRQSQPEAQTRKKRKEKQVKSRKTPDQEPSRSSTATAVTTSTNVRKPWKKRSPVEVVIDQINKLRDDVTQREEELKQSKKQLLKLDEVLKTLEST
jgi:hypothetical protein